MATKKADKKKTDRTETKTDRTGIWRWTPDLANKLRFPVADAQSWPANFSQAWQDVFALSVLDGKRNGRYLEVGAQAPVSNNNSFLMSRFHGWTGVSIEIEPVHLKEWLKERPNDGFLIANALSIDYSTALDTWFGSSQRRLDYLQLDIDPSSNTLKVLQSLPLDTWRFSVITFETDAYAGDLHAREASRHILQSHGYELAIPDVRVLFQPIADEPIPFEDWWVDPQVVSADKLAQIRQAARSGFAQDVIFVE